MDYPFPWKKTMCCNHQSDTQRSFGLDPEPGDLIKSSNSRP